jgi:methionyl-tRNA formyltransferase
LGKLKIIFYGTAEFAVQSLVQISERGFKPLAVVTAPDRKAGRGLKLIESPVKIATVELGIPVLQPVNLKADEFLSQIKELNPEIQVIVAFRMLPEKIWNFPPKGTINLHASLLPQYRGAAPIHWALINGEKETGVTTFFLKHDIDTGNIILQERETIEEKDNLESLYKRLKMKGAELLVKTLEAIHSDAIVEKPQEKIEELKKAPKINRDDAKINWGQTATEVYNFVRGMNPFPGAWTRLNGKNLKVFWVKGIPETTIPPGIVESDGEQYVKVGCGTGSVLLEEIQMEGKRKMKIKEFLKGNSI